MTENVIQLTTARGSDNCQCNCTGLHVSWRPMLTHCQWRHTVPPGAEDSPARWTVYGTTTTPSLTWRHPTTAANQGRLCGSCTSQRRVIDARAPDSLTTDRGTVRNGNNPHIDRCETGHFRTSRLRKFRCIAESTPRVGDN